MKFYIIRHGNPDYANDCLTELGKRQAEVLVPRLADYGITRIFTSPMGRARETAAPACEALGLTPKVEEWAHEIRFYCNHPSKGRIFGTCAPEETMRSEEVFSLGENWHTHPLYADTGAGEEIAAIHAAADQFLETLGYKREGSRYRILSPNEENIALFCHGGLGTVLISYLLGIPDSIGVSMCDLYQTGVTLLEFKNTETGYTAPRCGFHNDTSHLFAENMEIL